MKEMYALEDPTFVVGRNIGGTPGEGGVWGGVCS